MAVLLILALLIGLPTLEILSFIEVGAQIGGFATIALVLATAVLGAILFRLQGRSALIRARHSMAAGETPLVDVLDGVGLVIAAGLLFIPGFVTDALGFLMFAPPVRILLLGVLARGIMRRAHFTAGMARTQGGTQAGTQGGTQGGRRDQNPVIDGEFEEVDRDRGDRRLGTRLGTRPDTQPDTQKKRDPL